MHDAKWGEYGTGKGAKSGKPRFAVDHKGQHAAPEERGYYEAVAEHCQALVQNLQMHRKHIGCNGHRTKELAENNDDEVGDNRHET